MLDIWEKIKSLRVSVIFFDLDDTLYDSVPVYEEGLLRAYDYWKQQRIPNDSFSSLEIFRNAYQDARIMCKELAPHSPSRHHRLIYFKNLVCKSQGKILPDLIRGLHQAYEAAYQAFEVVDLRPNLLRLSQMFQLGIITNQTLDGQLKKLVSIDPRGEIFKLFLTSEEMGVEKPHPSVFLEACKRLNVEPSQCVMVGDSYETDVLGAIGVGMKAIHLDSSMGVPVELYSEGLIIAKVRSLF